MKIPKILGEKTVYKSPRTLVKKITLRFEKTGPVEWEYPQVADGINAIPLLPNNNIILAREWRPAWKQPILQIPGGNCLAKNETGRISQIRRELQEEIGMDARKVKKLISYAVVAGIHKKLHIYLATDLYVSTRQKEKEDEHEYIDTITMPLNEAVDLFLSGREFTTSYTLIGLLLVQKLLEK